MLRLLINQVDRRTVISRKLAGSLTEVFREDQIFRTAIPVNTAFEQAEAAGTTIFQFNPNVSGARAFRDLARELLAVCYRLLGQAPHPGRLAQELRRQQQRVILLAR